MSHFNKALLRQIKDAISTKQAFIPSPQTQEQIVAAQQSGALPPPEPPTPGADGTPPPVGFDQIAQMIQQSNEAVMQALQQIGQMTQQIGQIVQTQSQQGGGEEKKKMSVGDRLTKLEEMLAQAMGGGGAPPQDPNAGALPPEDPNAGAPPPQDPNAGMPPQ